MNSNIKCNLELYKYIQIKVRDFLELDFPYFNKIEDKENDLIKLMVENQIFYKILL